jgi:hypothetical protein
MHPADFLDTRETVEEPVAPATPEPETPATPEPEPERELDPSELDTVEIEEPDKDS